MLPDSKTVAYPISSKMEFSHLDSCLKPMVSTHSKNYSISITDLFSVFFFFFLYLWNFCGVLWNSELSKYELTKQLYNASLFPDMKSSYKPFCNTNNLATWLWFDFSINTLGNLALKILLTNQDLCIELI